MSVPTTIPKVTKATIKAVRSGKLAPLRAYLDGGGAPNWKINGGNDTLLIMARKEAHAPRNLAASQPPAPPTAPPRQNKHISISMNLEYHLYE